jgi:hypothetical protein
MTMARDSHTKWRLDHSDAASGGELVVDSGYNIQDYVGHDSNRSPGPTHVFDL